MGVERIRLVNIPHFPPTITILREPFLWESWVFLQANASRSEPELPQFLVAGPFKIHGFTQETVSSN